MNILNNIVILFKPKPKIVEVFTKIALLKFIDDQSEPNN